MTKVNVFLFNTLGITPTEVLPWLPTGARNNIVALVSKILFVDKKMPGKKKSKGKKGGKSKGGGGGGAPKGGYADPFAPSDEIPPPPRPGESVSYRQS